MCLWRVIRLTTYVLVVMVSLTTTQEYIDKRTLEDDKQWFLGPRFGRSSGGTSGQQSSSRRLVVTSRRDNKFHSASRFGKRTHGFSGSAAIVRTAPTDTFTSLISPSTAAAEKSQNVQCSYTGVADLYRCHVRKENRSDEILSK